MDSARQHNATDRRRPTVTHALAETFFSRSALIYASLTCPTARASALRFPSASYRARTPNRQGSIPVDDCPVLTSAPSAGEQLQSGAIDVALCRTSVSADPSLFHFEWLREEQVGVVVSPRHPLARKSEVTWQDTAEYPWVLFPSHTPLRTLLEREAANQNIVISPSHIEASSTFATALLLSKSDTLIALPTQESINFFETTKVLKALPIRFSASAEPYGIVTRAGPVNNPNVAKLCECVRWTRQRQLEAS